MSPDPNDEPRTAAIEQLEQFGLSAYAARTFVALVGLGTGTATDVSRVSSVPRTRVYDAAAELHERGLVDIRQSSPREFWPVSAETAGEQFQREFRRRTGTLRTALDDLKPTGRTSEQPGVWTVDGHEAVTDRLLAFIERADEEVVFMTVEALLTEGIVDGLREAADRGVDIKVAGLSPAVRERIEATVPEAEPFDSLWLGSETPAGRLLMVDRTRTLVSVRTNGPDEAATAPRSETAIWGSGEANGLVVVLRAIFTWQLDTAG